MTLRSMFSLMPPTRHHHDPEQSDVLAHICTVLGCDLDRASRAFNSMRNIKSRVLVFDGQSRMWRGCDWIPSDTDSVVRSLQGKIFILEKEIKFIRKLISVRKRVRTKSKLKEVKVYLACPCGSRGFRETVTAGCFNCKVCGKTSYNNDNLDLYNLWDINGIKTINGDGI